MISLTSNLENYYQKINNSNKIFGIILTWIAIAPSFVADKLFNDPPKDPIGVLEALTMNTSLKIEDVDMHRLVLFKPYSSKIIFRIIDYS